VKSKAFNPAALKIARELDGMASPGAIIAESAIAMLQLKVETDLKLKEQTAGLRETADNAEKQLRKLRTDARREIAIADAKHEDVMQRLRAAQPELQDIEFRINLEEGTFTPERDRSLDAQDNETPEKNAPKETVVNITEMVNDLLSRIGGLR